MAIERVLYLLGAGFSAPLGLPVMSNFLMKSKDQFAERSSEYAFFPDVFHLVERLSKIKNVYDTDLFNIEEILSILEMESALRGEPLKQQFLDYLCAVIRHYMPTIPAPVLAQPAPSNWYEVLFRGGPAGAYALFTANLFRLRITRHRVIAAPGMRGEFSAASELTPTRYSVVTLNYDEVLEGAAQALTEWFEGEQRFVTTWDAEDADWARGPYLAKLHGSVADGRIVAPTWSKGIDQVVLPAWQLAYRLLAGATQIRIIGYSLPLADAYVKYLLKAAALDSDRLKQIDIVCLDPDGTVRRRYEDFLDFPNVRFQAGEALMYVLGAGRTGYHYDRDQDSALFQGLEFGHQQFMAT